MVATKNVVVRGPKFGTYRYYNLMPFNTAKTLAEMIEKETGYKNVQVKLLGQKGFFSGKEILGTTLKPEDIIVATGDQPPENNVPTYDPAEGQLPNTKNRAYINLATSFHDMYTNPQFADLQIVIRDRDDESKEHVILAHKFILDAFAPGFLEQLLSSPLAIEGNKENNNNSNNNSSENNNNNNNNKENNIQRVYYTEFSPKLVKLFLEQVYTLSIKNFGNTSHEEMIEYKSMLSLYASEFTSIEDRSYVLESQINSPNFSDIVFVCEEGKRIHAHKEMLSVMCEVFRAMFDPNVGLAESRQSEVALPGVSADAFLNVLRYIYSANLKIDTPVAVEVLMLADQYCLRYLKYAAQLEIRSAILVENVCDFACLALQTQSSFLLGACVIFMADHLQEVVLSDGFSTLDSDIIEKISTCIVSRIQTNYDPSIFITEILSTIQQLKGTIAMGQCSRLLTDLCTRIGKSREEDQLYTSNVRSDLLKDKFTQLKVPFEEITHESYLASNKWIEPTSRRSPFYKKKLSEADHVSVTSLMASQLKIDVGLVMKNLVFWWKDATDKTVSHYVTVLTCSDKRVDEKKLGAHLNLPDTTRISLAEANFVYKVTGASALMRRIPPFGFRKKIKTIIEKHVLDLERIYVPTGREETTWSMTPSSLVSMLEKLGIEHETAELL
eukprot:Phypoly_transcript_04231.p1 GENE.Phypoly_transcript_04231~~Phypoly_transcript_04231.p1  ORF type:complete len:669 (+),score=118.87 Phypoly_transcript_04231:190-2196(+)